MTNVQLFQFKDKQIRTILKDGQIWFVAKDVTEGLGIKWQGDKSLLGVKQEWKGVWSNPTPGGVHDTIIISEQAVYKLAFKSKKKNAQEFTDFMADVAVSLRKGESVSLNKKTPAQALLESVQLMVKHEQDILELQTKQHELESRIINRPEDYYSLAGWINLHKYKPRSSNELKVIGMYARKISDVQQVEVKTVADEKWGKVNIYHTSILKQLNL